MNKLKVIQLLPELNVGGVERGTTDFSRALVENGHESIVISNGGIYEKDIKKLFGHKHLDEITDSEIQTLHVKVTQRAPIMANKCLEVLKELDHSQRQIKL